MNKKMKNIIMRILFGALFLAFIFFSISMYFVYVVEPQGMSYLAADIISPEEWSYYTENYAENYIILSYNLTYQDFKDYPVLGEMIKYNKRIFISPDTIIGSIPVFGRRSAYSKTEISKQDADILLRNYSGNKTHIIALVYNGTYYHVGKVIS